MEKMYFFVFSVNQHTKNVHNIQNADNSECVMIIAVSHLSRMVIKIRKHKQVFILNIHTHNIKINSLIQRISSEIRVHSQTAPLGSHYTFNP